MMDPSQMAPGGMPPDMQMGAQPPGMMGHAGMGGQPMSAAQAIAMLLQEEEASISEQEMQLHGRKQRVTQAAAMVAQMLAGDQMGGTSDHMGSVPSSPVPPGFMDDMQEPDPGMMGQDPNAGMGQGY